MILRSRDLVNWSIVGHAVNDGTAIGPELNWDRMNRYARGVWACAKSGCSPHASLTVIALPSAWAQLKIVSAFAALEVMATTAVTRISQAADGLLTG